VFFSDLTLPRKRHEIHGSIHKAAKWDCPEGKPKVSDGGQGGTATLHIPKILSFGEVKISA
jgi:hypothetical protein